MAACGTKVVVSKTVVTETVSTEMVGGFAPPDRVDLLKGPPDCEQDTALESANDGQEESEFSEDEGASVDVFLHSVGLEKYKSAFQEAGMTRMGQLFALNDDAIEDLCEDVELKKADKRNFLKAFSKAQQDAQNHAALEFVKQDMLDFLESHDLTQYAANLYRAGHADLHFLETAEPERLIEIATDANFKPEDRTKLRDIIAEQRRAAARAPSTGGLLAKWLFSKPHIRKSPDYKGSGLDIVYLPFRSLLRKEYTFKCEDKPHRAGLSVMEADVPVGYVDPDIVKEVVMLVVGATGAGKSTQIDAILNYLMGIKSAEPFRYKCVDELMTVRQDALEAGSAASQTDDITCYKIPAMKDGPIKSKVTIIDTPGFGDSRGMDFDKKIVDQIKKLFRDDEDAKRHVPYLTCISFITPASVCRLTQSQKFVWDSILGLFAGDLAKNVLISFTFADGQPAQAEGAIKAGNIPHEGLYKFNNSALFANLDDTISASFWDLGKKSMDHYFSKLTVMSNQNLDGTRTVLEERERLEGALEALPTQIKLVLGAAETLRQESTLLACLDDEMTAAADFTYTVEVAKFDKKPAPSGVNTTTCTTCDWTCHDSCAYANDGEKASCGVMSDGNCTRCPKKCHWSAHQNLPYYLTWSTVKENRTADDLKGRYVKAKSDISAKEQILEGLLEDVEKAQTLALSLIERMRNAQNRLSEIALRPNVMPPTDYLQQMIENEQRNRKPGYSKRISALEQLKHQGDLLKKVSDPNFNILADFAGDDKVKVGLQHVKKKNGQTGHKQKTWCSWFGL